MDIAKRAYQNGFRVFDLNIGPAKASLSGTMEYLTKLLDKNFDAAFSFDTSNFDEMEAGFASVPGGKAEKSFLNSVCADDEKMKRGFDIAKKYDSNVIALTFNPMSGIAKTSDERLELAFQILENAAGYDINQNKIYFDPLVLPVSVAQNQANVVLEIIRMLKEGMEDIHTIVGLSNISNGSPKELRPLINRVFLVLAMGAGLDSAIVDGFDTETFRIYNLISASKAADSTAKLTSLDRLYFSLYNTVSSFGDIDEVEYDKNSAEETAVIKTARVLLDREIYSHSFCAIKEK